MKLIRPHRKFIQNYIEAIEEDGLFRPNAQMIFSNPRQS